MTKDRLVAKRWHKNGLTAFLVLFLVSVSGDDSFPKNPRNRIASESSVVTEVTISYISVDIDRQVKR